MARKTVGERLLLRWEIFSSSFRAVDLDKLVKEGPVARQKQQRGEINVN